MIKRRYLAIGLLAASSASCGDDSTGTISLTAVTVPAGESGEIIVTAQRTGGSDGSITVPFTTRDGSAVEITDYTAATGSLTWGDGDTEDKTISISIVDDVAIETSEDLVIELGSPSGGFLGTSSMTATILDDDHMGDSYAVTTAGRLMHFDRVEVGRFSYAVDLSGLGTETVLGIDVRPADGKLYAITSGAKLYTIDPTTGVATVKSSLIADPTDASSPFTAISGTDVGIDFNPVVDRLRITTTTGQNLRINVDTGEVTTDTAINGLSTGYGAVAYSNNVAPACRTTLYAIDVATNRFLSQSPPNDGMTNGIGGLGLDATASGGFDVMTDAAGVSSGFALLTVDGVTGSYAIDLASGAATVLRAAVGPLPTGETVVSFAMPALPAATPVTQLAGEVYGVTATGLVSFNRASPAKLCTSRTINGLAAGDSLVGIDMRPATGVLYVLANNAGAGKLHRVDPATGNLSPAIPVSVALQGTEFGVDFNPAADGLRIVSNTGQNLRVTNLTTGAATTDTALNGAGTSAVGAAYTDAVPGAGTTTLYVIDATADRLRIQNPPNSGLLVDVGPLGVDITDVSGFDIDGRDNSAVLVTTTGTTSTLHSLDVTTGTVSASLGVIGGGAPVRGITRVTPQMNLFGVTTDNKLVRISMTDPSMVTTISDPMLMPPVDTITGLAAGEHLVGIDVRPGTNVMYGVGSLGAVYSLNGSTAAANPQGTLSADPLDTTSPFAGLSGTSFGVDFNPTGPIAMRVVSDAEQNLRIPNVAMPKAFTDLPLTPGPVDVSAAAYTNSFAPPAGVTASTTLYVIDVTSGQLMIQEPPNNGTLTAVGPLALTGSLSDPAVPSLNGFDIGGGNNGIALAAFQRPSSTPGVPEAFSRLYRINLVTGAATEIGTGIGGAPLRGLAIQIR